MFLPPDFILFLEIFGSPTSLLLGKEPPPSDRTEDEKSLSNLRRRVDKMIADQPVSPEIVENLRRHLYGGGVPHLADMWIFNLSVIEEDEEEADEDNDETGSESDRYLSDMLMTVAINECWPMPRTFSMVRRLEEETEALANIAEIGSATFDASLSRLHLKDTRTAIWVLKHMKSRRLAGYVAWQDALEIMSLLAVLGALMQDGVRWLPGESGVVLPRRLSEGRIERPVRRLIDDLEKRFCFESNAHLMRALYVGDRNAKDRYTETMKNSAKRLCNRSSKQGRYSVPDYENAKHFCRNLRHDLRVNSFAGEARCAKRLECEFTLARIMESLLRKSEAFAEKEESYDPILPFTDWHHLTDIVSEMPVYETGFALLDQLLRWSSQSSGRSSSPRLCQ